MAESRDTIPERPRSDALFACGRRRGSATTVMIPRATLLFRDATLIAIVVGDVVYFPEPRSTADQRELNTFAPEVPHVRLAAAEFDFVVGAALSSAGLPLTRRT